MHKSITCKITILFIQYKKIRIEIMIPDDHKMMFDEEMYLRETIHSLHVNLTSAFFIDCHLNSKPKPKTH